MRTLSALNRNKRAVSIVVSYVLLITISISLSVLVYNWLRFYVNNDDIPECSSNVNIVIQNYACVRSDLNQEEQLWTPGNLQITLKNKGMFNISGFKIRVHDREDAEFGIYTLDEEGVQMAPGEEFYREYNFNQVSEKNLETLTLVEVQPFIKEEGEIICKSYAIQKVEC